MNDRYENENQRSYLEMIQGVINRLANNSSRVKTWLMLVLTFTYGFALTSNGNSRVALVAVIMSVIFWFLDANYLKLERSFRDLYERAIQNKTSVFDMKLSQNTIGLKAFFNAFKSWSVFWFYFVSVCIGIIIFVFS